MSCAPLTAYQHPTDRAAERDLRTGLLQLGAMLGWDTRTVARFTEAVTGRPWRRCGPADLRRVLGAYEALGRRIRAAQVQQPDAGRSDGRTA